MTRNLVAILIENERVLLMKNNNLSCNSWAFPTVKSDSPNELITLLSKSLQSFSFENAKIYPFVSFPVEQTDAFIVSGYARNGNHNDDSALMWVHGYVKEFNYDRTTSRLLVDLQREDLILGSNNYY
jgi:hypothetical protein